jgi:hypothetical protein
LAPPAAAAAVYCTSDVDANGASDALTDGLLIIRHLFGFSGPTLTDGALAADATRTDPAEIAAYIKANEADFDVDANGVTDALTDGLLIIRRLFGFSGTTITDGALAPDAARTDPAEIAAHIDDLSTCSGQAQPDLVVSAVTAPSSATIGDLVEGFSTLLINSAWETGDNLVITRPRLRSP